MSRLNGEVERLGAELGFSLAGVARAGATEYAPELIAWLGAGRHGSMAYLAEHLDARLNPERVLPGARSVVMVADQYAARGAVEEPLPARQGRIARYARGRDYHRVMKDRLHVLADALRDVFPGDAFRVFVDTAPVPEREYAARAGLGWVGKNTLIIHPRLGSYLLLGGILTTIEAEEPASKAADHCGGCTRCIDACPTRAITPYSVDATRCISYLTIERREAIDEALSEGIGDWLYGCDICQEVCPHNSARPAGPVGAVREDYQSRRAGFDLLEVLRWDEGGRRRAFERSAMKRATLEMMKRNAIIVAGNLLTRRDDPELLRRLRELAESAEEPEMVRQAAARTLARVELRRAD